MSEQLDLVAVVPVETVDAQAIPASYWRVSLRPAYRGASQEALDVLLAECREAGGIR